MCIETSDLSSSVIATILLIQDFQGFRSISALTTLSLDTLIEPNFSVNAVPSGTDANFHAVILPIDTDVVNFHSLDVVIGTNVPLYLPLGLYDGQEIQFNYVGALSANYGYTIYCFTRAVGTPTEAVGFSLGDTIVFRWNGSVWLTVSTSTISPPTP